MQVPAWWSLAMGLVAVWSLLPAPATLLPLCAVEGMTCWSHGSCPSDPCPRCPRSKPPPQCFGAGN